MHLYTINIDAAPLFEGVEAVLARAGFRHSFLHVNGLFTAPTMKSCYYGKTFDSVTSGDLFLIDALLARGFGIGVHEDHLQFTPQYLGEEPDFGAFEGTELTLGRLVPKLKNERYRDIVLSTSGDSIGRRFQQFLKPAARAKFMEKEREFIRRVQSGTDDRYLHVLQSHFHDLAYFKSDVNIAPQAHLSVVAESLATWLGFWDFDEPDAVFFVFSDHGDHVERLTPPRDYLKWCFFKDNTRNPIHLGKKLVSGIDLFPTLLDRAGVAWDSNGYSCHRFDASLDTDRIYFSADTRLWDENYRGGAVRETTPDKPSAISGLPLNATAMRIVDWTDDGYPATLLQATHYVPTGRFYFAFFDFHPTQPVYRFHRFNRSPHVHLPIASVAGRPKLKSELARLSEALIGQFPWITSRSFRDDLAREELAAWFSP